MNNFRRPQRYGVYRTGFRKPGMQRMRFFGNFWLSFQRVRLRNTRQFLLNWLDQINNQVSYLDDLVTEDDPYTLEGTFVEPDAPPQEREDEEGGERSHRRTKTSSSAPIRPRPKPAADKESEE